jgi:hypothetical protein
MDIKRSAIKTFASCENFVDDKPTLDIAFPEMSPLLQKSRHRMNSR